jgi:hypothetical protein
MQQASRYKFVVNYEKYGKNKKKSMGEKNNMEKKDRQKVCIRKKSEKMKLKQC